MPRAHLKKKSLVATERRRAKVRHARYDLLKRRIPDMRLQPERLVFIDETSVKTNITRLRGRAVRGQRLEMDAPFGNWRTQTIIAGLTRDTLIALWIIKGAMDGPAFAAYVKKCLFRSRRLGASSSSIILPRTATPRRHRPSVRPVAGPSTCRHTQQTLIPSSKRSQSSKPICERSTPDPLSISSTRSATSAGCSHQTSAGTTSRLLGMYQVKTEKF